MHYPASTKKPVPRHNILGIYIITIALLISLTVFSPVFAEVASNETAISGTYIISPESLKGEYRHPLMQFTPHQLNEIREHYETAHRYNASIRLQGFDGNIPAGSKNLLPYLTYTPSERNQGMCGNCWVWASTGALEIENNVKSGIQDRLSVQSFNSRYNGGAGSNWACCGGWLGQFTSFYTGDRIAVPWSNTNAGWGDYYSSCGQYVTAVPAGSIATEPSYTIKSISDSSIETRGVGQSTAINNIKSALNENKPVWYAFYYGNNGWNAFENAWWSQSETSVFNPVPFAGEENTGGHAVLIVGYDDTDRANPYWIVLNSWGTTGNRPQGLFRVNMSLDYDSVIYSSGNPFPQHMFSILEADAGPTPPPVVNFTADTTYGSVPLSVQFTDQSSVVDPQEWDWDFGDGSHSASRNPQHEYTVRGSYAVTLNVINSSAVYSLKRLNYITVITLGPVPEFSAEPRFGQNPLAVSFTDASLTDPMVWAWFFGDENYSAPWKEVNANPGWTTRFSQTSVVLPDGSIVVTGGYDGSTQLDDVWRSTDNGATWSQMTPHAGWSPRAFHTMVAMSDGSIILMGGDDISDGGFLNDVWRSTDNGATWEEVTPAASWPGRAAHSSVVLSDDSIVVMGGNTGLGGGRLNDVWRSTDYGATWSQMARNAGWSPRWSQSVTAMPDGSIILTAGWNGAYQTDVWRSADKGATWTRVNNTLGGIARGFHSTVSFPDNSILMMGGINEAGGRNDVWRSTDRGATWTLLTDNAAWSDRYYLNGVAMPDARVILIGGRSGSGTSDIWQFLPAGSQEQNPVHTYTTPGTYTVALQVMNASGINSTRKTGYITVDISQDQEITISPGVPHIINNTLAYSGDNTTIILNPGVYYEHDIVIGHNVTIRANTSAGGNSANTIIDGQNAGRILDDSRNFDLVIDNLSFINGYSTEGGAIDITITDPYETYSSFINITSSFFFNCSAVYDGGAIHVQTIAPCCQPSPRITIISSTITNCSAARGGAIYINGGRVRIHFTRIYGNTDPINIWGSTEYTTLYAPDNWWGSNSDPSGLVSAGNAEVTTSPWLVLNITATPSTMTSAETSVIRANLTRNSAGTDTASGGVFVPYRGVVSFDMTQGSGSPTIHAITSMRNGSAIANLIKPRAGSWTASATVDSETVSHSITVTTGTIITSRIGAYNGGSWYLDTDDTGNPATATFHYFTAGPGSTAVIGDWNSDGKDEIGVFNNGAWYLDTAGTGKPATATSHYFNGGTGSTPVVGDWNNDGKDEIGVFNNGAWYLDTAGTGNPATAAFHYFTAGPGTTPVVGDWNNDGNDEIGVYNNGAWYLDTAGTGSPATATLHYFNGGSGSTPVVGDWNNDGKDEIGVYNNGAWYLDTVGSGSPATATFHYFTAGSGSTPEVGDWNYDGKDEIGVYNNGAWYLDTAGSGSPATATFHYFTAGSGSTPVVGKWN